MRARQLSEPLGVELLDVDVTKPLSSDDQIELRRLFCEHHLVAVRGPEMSDEDQDRFVGYFGPLQVASNGTNAEYVTNQKHPLANEKVGNARLMWHSDGAYSEHPEIGVSLWAKQVAPEAAPTMFANARRALEHLPAPLRSRIESLTVVHLVDREGYSDEGVTYGRTMESDIPAEAPAGRYLRWEHPVVYEMPHTKQHVVYVNEVTTSHIVGLPAAESEALIQELFAHVYADENVYCHRWVDRDLLVWDNNALQHCRPTDARTATRHLRRQTLDGWNTGDGVMSWTAPPLNSIPN